ncbi:MAG: PQQ-binding-like beta-propeller repeat protein [Sedimentisphaerales bacterium]
MLNQSKTIVILGICFIMLLPTLTRAQDWPQWRGPDRDAKVTGFKVPQTWPKELNQKWKVNVGLGDSTPALVDGKIYVFARQGSDEVLLCLNADDKTELWRESYSAPAVTGPPSSHPGPRSSPAVASGKVFTFGVAGTLSCIDVETHKVLWRRNDYPDARPQFYTAMSPLIVDKLCIAHVGKESEGALIAYNIETGEPEWKWTGEGPTYSSPMLMTVDGVRQVVINSEKDLLGISLDEGKQLWSIPTPNQRMFYSCPTAIIDGQTIYYTGQGTGSKAVKISKNGDEFTHEELWNNTESGTTFNTPVLKDGFLYGMNPQGHIFCIDAKTGKTTWTGSETFNRFGTIVDAGQVLFALSSQSELAVFEPNEKEYNELARYKVADSEVYAYPIISGNRIYVKDQDSLTLWTID